LGGASATLPSGAENRCALLGFRPGINLDEFRQLGDELESDASAEEDP
jgi:hypothetical protein